MQSNSLKTSIINGLFWQYTQRIGNQLVQFVVSIILARILAPEDFGVIALIGVFITISNIFIDSGLGNALIQKKDLEAVDKSSVFYINLLISFCLYALIFLAAPYIAGYYGMSSLDMLLRVQAIQIVIMAFYCVQNSVLVRNMEFKLIFIINFVSILVSSIVGISLACLGYGVWSLVCSQIAMQMSKVIGFWLFSNWRPIAVFSFERVRQLFGYSSRILGGSLLHVCYSNIYNIIIGKQFSVSLLGYYNRGQLIPTIIIENAANSINSVMFPALSRIQDEKDRFLLLIRNMVSIVAYIVSLIIAILLPLSSNIISVLLTDKWLPCVPFMQIVCITVCFTPFILINSSILTALGESSKYLMSSIYSKVLSIVLIIVASFGGIYCMVGAGCIAAIASVLITGYWNRSLIHYKIKDYLHDVCPSFLLAIFTSACIYGIVLWVNLPSFYVILVGSIVGVLIFVSLSRMLKFKQMELIINLIKKGN